MILGSFDLLDPLVLLRLACGLFFLPHIGAKVLPPRPAIQFFRAAGFPVPGATMALAAAIESAVCLGLVLGVHTRWAGLLGAALLVVAAGAVFKLQLGGRPKWLWNLGGVEYPLFWALACVVVALKVGEGN